MPSPVAHTLAGLCLAEAAGRRRGGPGRPVVAAVLVAANLPDADFAPLLLGLDPGQLFHQSVTHSVAFVLVSTLALALLLRKRLPLGRAWALLLLAGLGHLALDLVSVDRRPPIGVPLLWPFSDGVWHSPVTLFLGLDKSSLARLPSVGNLAAVAVEAAWLLPPYLLLRLRRPRAPGGTRP